MALRKKIDELPRVLVLGAGKVGTALARAMRRAGYSVQVQSARGARLRREIAADLVIVAVRDPQISEFARLLVPRVLSSTIVVHTAGALDASVLDPLASHVAGVAQMHPLLSFASREVPPKFGGAMFLLSGDASALRMVKKVVRAVGGISRVVQHVDHARYHAAAALLANGSATLAALATSLMSEAGLPQKHVRLGLAALLRSVADNLETVGVPDLLSGPVRRGDLEAVVRQAALLTGPARDALVGLLGAQVDLAAAIGDASQKDLSAIRRWLRSEMQ